MELRHSASHKATILPALALLKLAIILCHAFPNVGACLDGEREALNTFRKALHIPSAGLLSSWDQGDDCCKWSGVSCNNDTGYVIRLEPFADVVGWPDPPSMSGVSADNLGWLRNMTSLEYLDMSGVDLSLASDASHHWFHVIMNGCPSLIELRLADCRLSHIPPSLPFVNFTSLRVLDIAWNDFEPIIPNWIANISSLISLDLSYNKNFGVYGGSIPDGLGRLKKLAHLDLRYGGLSGPIPASLGGLSSLKTLDMSENRLSGPIPASLGGLSSLKTLDLSDNQLNGTIPETLGRLSSLEDLHLRWNQLSGPIPVSLGGLSSLKTLDLLYNQLNGTIPETVGRLSSLKEFYLEGNQLNGSIPETLGGLSSLEGFNLAGNRLNGNIPTALGQLSNLVFLDLSGNFLNGNVSEAHFENLRKLQGLVLDGNPLVMDLQPHWIPTFQLGRLSLESVNVGPRFPLWLRTQKNIDFLGIPNAYISDVIPTWFWDIGATARFLNLSGNMLSGQLPNTLKMMDNGVLDLSRNFLNGSIPCISSLLDVLDLSNNQFSGPMPTNCTYPSTFFIASSNQISGTIPSSICKMSSMEFLDLSSNSLSGTISATIGNCTGLFVLDLSDNHLSGSIPRSMGSLMDLDKLHLNGNGLYGELPSSLKNCGSLRTLDLGDNKFHGKIPSWIGKSFTGLRILSLRGNLFTGGIPPQLFHLTSLQVFDVSHNWLCGPLPPTVEDLKAMKNKTHREFAYPLFGASRGIRVGSVYIEDLNISSKGQTLTYTKTISLLTCIDLSSNNFSGEIPDALTTLSGLSVLNLSGNHLIGNIPSNIGRLVMLESLDLSRNELSGIIPQSISNLYFLSVLNLSHNNLSGRIPKGKQIQTLIDPSIYAGNAGLCGFPLSDCGGKGEDGKNQSGEGNHQDEKDHVMFWFYLGIGPGFVVGFWTICGILILKESWRIAYFRLVDDMADKFYIFVMRWMARLKQKMADGNKTSGQ